MASAGKEVFAVSPACFLTARALEQIKADVAYSNHPVKLVGISAGVSYGALGSTHHSLHDLAVLRAIHNVDVVVPSDNVQTRAAVLAAAEARRPVYLRFGKAPLFTLHNADARFEMGKAMVLREGGDVCLIACGETVAHALLAAEKLREKGIAAGVVDMHTIKPLDAEAVERAGKCRAVITVEEHSVHGGLGEGCAGVLMAAGSRARFRIVGIPDEETFTGSQADIFAHYGISMEGLAGVAMAMLG